MITYLDAKKLLSYDLDTGDLTWISDRKCIKAGNKAGYIRHDGYACIKVNGSMYLAHRIAWLLHYGEWPNGVIDHIDHNKSNNRITNLRDVSVTVNNQNKVSSYNIKNRTSKYIGVNFVKSYGMFEARIKVNKKQIFLGCFKTEIEAYEKYLSAKRAMHEGSTL